MIKSILLLIRPHQWAKNMFVFLPLFFGGQLLNKWCWEQSLIAFAAFSLIASSIYCLNDLIDIEADRQHPEKCKRPLASGRLLPSQAIIIGIVLVILGFMTVFIFYHYHAISISIVLGIYLSINVAYCLKLKQYAIVDVMLVSLGFVLRLAAGGIVCDIWLSPWIISLTFLLALFLAFAKRRDDLLLHERMGLVTRKNIVRYNIDFLNQTLCILASVTLVCYMMYTVSPDVEKRLGSNYIYLTSLFVLAGILRYLQRTIVDSQSFSPTKILLDDRFIQTCIILWIATFLVIIYL